MNFEENSKKLQEIIDKLEKNQVSLEEATKLYEEGVLLAKNCYKILNQSKGKVNILKTQLDNLSVSLDNEDIE